MATTPAWADRVARLVRVVRDVAPPGHPLEGMPGSTRHAELFRQYVDALADGIEEATDWWQALIDNEQNRTIDPQMALANVRSRRPAGPVTYGSVVQVVRTYWLACAVLNERATVEADAVAPEEFLLVWLARSPQRKLAEFLADLPFWPLGLDDKGRWI